MNSNAWTYRPKDESFSHLLAAEPGNFVILEIENRVKPTREDQCDGEVTSVDCVVVMVM